MSEGRMIEIRQHMAPNSRTANSGSAWIAEAVVDGAAYSARSRHGAPMALARELVAAGVIDQPVTVRSDGVAGFLAYRSLHKLAGRTIAESATRSVHVEKWSEFSGVVGKIDGEAPGDDKQAAEDFTPINTHHVVAL